MKGLSQFKSAREIAFVDSAVPHREVLAAGLREDVAAVFLSGQVDARQQIGIALAQCESLETIHVIAHGRPGETMIGSTPLAIHSLEEWAPVLADIKAALCDWGRVCLWSCDVGRGEKGRQFIEAFSSAISAPVFAAVQPVGAADRGGHWKLQRASRSADTAPPLTPAGVAQYAGVLSLAWNPATETGVEDSSISLGVISGATGTVVISGIPVGAKLSDGVHSFTATSSHTSVSLSGWNLSALKITPPTDTDFTLTATSGSQTATEAVTVNPLPPSISWSASTEQELKALRSPWQSCQPRPRAPPPPFHP